ncbi:MAG: universal stress protein [Lutibacter sp.]|uniref:universal stress protein n=1 Tax=Lutibacter sp. TaxID=1925666 RepID=UPI00385DDFF2
MKNILILTDFSDNSWNSITYTLALFKNKSCNFYLLNGVNKHEEYFVKNSRSLVKIKEKKDAKTAFDKLAIKVANSPLKGAHRFFPIIAEIDIIEAARAQIKEKNIDLVVIGTNGLSYTGRQNNISPISEDIITKLKSSILVVPFEAHFSGLKEIAFPTDYTNFKEAKLLQKISDLIKSHKASTSFVYMTKKINKLDKEQQWNKETLHDYFLNQPHSFHVEVNEDFELTIENFIDTNGVDLIVMAAKNLNLFEQILFRPKIKNIKYYFKTPFLVIH